jgi:hypothetical protein
MSQETENMLWVPAAGQAIDQGQFAEAVALICKWQGAQTTSLLAIAEAVLEEVFGPPDTKNFYGDPDVVTFMALWSRTTAGFALQPLSNVTNPCWEGSKSTTVPLLAFALVSFLNYILNE